MVSFIIPVHNQSDILVNNMARLQSSIPVDDYEIIIAEDGSTDGFEKIAPKLKKKGIRILSYKEKLGRGKALENAFMESNSDVVFYMDADLATDLPEIKNVLSMIDKGYDIVTGSRLLKGSKVIGRSFLRTFFSRSYNAVLRILFKSKIYDHQCGFKAFRKKTVLPLLGEVKDSHWFWDSELLIVAQRHGLRVVETPVKWTEKGNSRVRLSTDIIYMGLAAIKLRFGRMIHRPGMKKSIPRDTM
jgi:glycosyltransferase involved in cell wall biosynthesis